MASSESPIGYRLTLNSEQVSKQVERCGLRREASLYIVQDGGTSLLIFFLGDELFRT